MYLNHIQLYYNVLSFQYLEDELYAGPPWRSVLVTEVATLVKERINKINKYVSDVHQNMEVISQTRY